MNAGIMEQATHHLQILLEIRSFVSVFVWYIASLEKCVE